MSTERQSLTRLHSMALPVSLTAAADHHSGQSSDLDICNPKIVHRNRLPTRSYWIPEKSLVLNGTWSFVYSATPKHAPHPTLYSDGLSSLVDALANDGNDGQTADIKWSSITVPGHWQLQVRPMSYLEWIASCTLTSTGLWQTSLHQHSLPLSSMPTFCTFREPHRNLS
jgi:hypothetical protein